MSHRPPPSSISVVIPSYNEKNNIGDAVRRIEGALDDTLLEIIVVDDDSPDRTWEVVERLNNPRCRLIRRLDTKGLASALADGTRAAKGEIIVWLDCDLGIPPEDIVKLVEQLDEYDVAVGSRYVPGGMDKRPKFRAFLSVLFNVYARLILGRHFWDYTSGFAAAHRRVLQETPLSDVGFGEYFVEWIYNCSRKNYRIIEVPYHYSIRQSGTSKTDSNLLVFLKHSVSYVWRVITVRLGTP